MKKQRNNITDAGSAKSPLKYMGVLVKGKTRNTRIAQEIIAPKNTRLPITAYVQCSFHFISSSGSWDGGLNRMIRNRLGILFWQELVLVVMCSLPG